jgi:hypothetical protein
VRYALCVTRACCLLLRYCYRSYLYSLVLYIYIASVLHSYSINSVLHLLSPAILDSYEPGYAYCIAVTSKTHHWVSAKASGCGRSSYGSWADRSRASRYIFPPGSLIAPQGFVSIQYFTDISDFYPLCLTIAKLLKFTHSYLPSLWPLYCLLTLSLHIF